MLAKLDSLSTNPEERKALSEQIQALSKEVEMLTASRDELVKRMAETDLSQASAMVKKAFEEFDKGNIKEAIALMPDDKLDAFMASARDAFRLGVENYMVKARFLVADLKFGEAKENYRKAIREDSMNLENLWEVAYFLQEQNDYQSAIWLFKRALTLPITERDSAGILNNLGTLLRGNILAAENPNEEAEVSFRKALDIQRRIAAKNPEAFMPELAGTLNNLGLLLNANDSFTEAEKSFDEALKILRKLVDRNPKMYLLPLAKTLHHLGNLKTDIENYDEAEKFYKEALSIKRKLAEKNPGTHLLSLAATYSSLGILYQKKQSYLKADSAYQVSLIIYKELAAMNPNAYNLEVCLTNLNYAKFKRELMLKTFDVKYKNEAIHLLQDNLLRLMNFTTFHQRAWLYQVDTEALMDNLNGFTPEKLRFDATIDKIALHEREIQKEPTPSIKVQKQRELLQQLQTAIKDASPESQRLLTGYYIQAQGSLTWYLMLNNEPKEAEELARQVLRYTDYGDMEWVNSNLALALLYQGKWDDAKGIYTYYKGNPYDKARNWTEVFLQDLDDLEAAGVKHPDVAKARALLRE
ncbi:MAG: tetratricopeptide repeat protein [Saprospiraceae bacterium]|nr:tetratricopeptide repeat protein [Saprospiraceae bacterium]